MFYKTQDTTMYYEKYGNGKQKIVILPGWGNTRKTFTYFIQHLKENYTIYIIDYPNFGNSSSLKKEWTMDHYALLIKNFLLNENIYNPIIIAHSFGGRISALLLGKYNIKVKKIILIDVAGIKRKKTFKVYLKEKIYKLLKKILSFFPNKKELNNWLQKRFSSEDYKNLPEHMKKTFQNIIQEDLRKYYKKITVETLIIWGSKDKDTPLKDGQYLEKQLKNSALIIYHNCGHFSYLENPYQTLLIIESFITKKRNS